MKIVYFTHSLRACWNHGNAHFLRGLLRELQALGHAVVSYERPGAWSLTNMIADGGPQAADIFAQVYPELEATTLAHDEDLAAAIDGADVVIVHEWNDPALVAALGTLRRNGRFVLLFHDTHHRAVSDPGAMSMFDLDAYDGILAFGARLADVYRRQGWGDRAHVLHEAADTNVFHPPAQERQREGLVWIGNWGDDERTSEIENFLLRPARDAGLPLDIYGVRYPAHALALLDTYAVHYRGWLANPKAPSTFARHLATVHVPRRYYASALPGIPTIRVFEALACCIPLLSAPWRDDENLFRVGQDFLMLTSGNAMRDAMREIAADAALRVSLVAHGLETIRARHTCAHRARELVAIIDRHRAVPEARAAQ